MAAMSRNRIFVSVIISIAALHGPAIDVFGQVKRDDLRRTLTEKSGMTAADLDRLAAGEVVVVPIETNDKQEVAVVGAARLGLVRAITIADLRSSLAPKRSTEVGDGAKFSTPPRIENLADMRLTEDDVEELEKCRIGDCDLNLSESAIRRLIAVRDGATDNRRDRLTEAFAKVLLEHLQAYQASGDRALGEYVNRRKKVSLSEAHQKLLRDALLLEEVAPDLAAELLRYPNDPSGSVESEFFWSTFDFGLKPMVTISHVLSFPADGATPRPLTIATKQIYASRYLDASLTLAMIVLVGDAAPYETYLVFTDRSRSDALEGMFGGFARRVVRNEAVKRVQELVATAKSRLEAPLQPEPTPAPPEKGTLTRITEWITSPWGLIFAAAALVILFLLFRRGRR